MRRIIDKQMASEMRTLRERGFSNAEIAAQLDLSYQSVYRVLGKQGFRAESSPTTAQAVPVAIKPTDFGLPVIRRRVTLKGLFCTFEMDSEDKNVVIKSLSPQMVLEGIVPLEALEFLGNEFIQASKK